MSLDGWNHQYPVRDRRAGKSLGERWKVAEISQKFPFSSFSCWYFSWSVCYRNVKSLWSWCHVVWKRYMHKFLPLVRVQSLPKVRKMYLVVWGDGIHWFVITRWFSMVACRYAKKTAGEQKKKEVKCVHVTSRNRLTPSGESDSRPANQEIPRRCITRRFIAVSTKASDWTVSWATCIQSSYPISLRSILILSYQLHLRLPSSLSYIFFHKIFVCISFMPHVCNTFFEFSPDSICWLVYCCEDVGMFSFIHLLLHPAYTRILSLELYHSLQTLFCHLNMRSRFTNVWNRILQYSCQNLMRVSPFGYSKVLMKKYR